MFLRVHHSKLITVLLISFANLVADRPSEYSHVGNEILKLLVDVVCLVRVSYACARSTSDLPCLHFDRNCAVHKY